MNWKHNLCGGAIPKIISDETIKNMLFEISKLVGDALNIKFATIDIIKTIDNSFYVLEVNSGVCMTKFVEQIEGGYNIAKSIYSCAIDKMFEK